MRYDKRKGDVQIMLNFELQSKLEDCLKNCGLEYDFSIDDNHFFDNPYGKFTSLTLRRVTGTLNNLITVQTIGIAHPSYDIELINKITKCLLDSRDEKLKSIAWNSFIDLAYDERFILFKEMKEARDSYFDDLEYNTNHTKIIESERLFIKPNNKEDGRSIYEYVNNFDKDEYLFARMARNCGSEDYFLFCLCLKETNEVIGDIGFAFDPNLKNTFNVSYYIKKEYRQQGYVKEAFKKILEAAKEDKIVLYGQWHREYVLEEIKPVIKLLRIELAENNIASFNTAKALGFEYEGKIVKYQRINNKDRYTAEHHFIKKII